MPANSVTTLPKLTMIRSDHHEERDAESEFLANQIAQALAGNGAHAGGNLLHHDQRHGDGDHGPQQHVPELGPGCGIGPDASGIVVHVRGNKTRTDDGEEDQKPDFPAFQEILHAQPQRLLKRPISINGLRKSG